MHILSRVADSVYWLNRYVERAENYARLVETYRLLSMENSAANAPLWQALVDSMADGETYRSIYGEIDESNVLEFLTFNRKNSNSIASCLYFARENARSIREKVSKDLWESINELHNYVEEHRGLIASLNWHDFFRRLRHGCHAFYGISDSTLNHDETYHFALLGRTIERAEKTTRILDLQSHTFTRSLEGQGGDERIYLSLALLKATSAHEMFNQVHAKVTAENILDFLLLNRTFPRAIVACLLQIEVGLRSVAGEQKGFFINPAQRVVRRLLLELKYVDIAGLMQEVSPGQLKLMPYLDDLQLRLNSVGAEISNAYFGAPEADLQVFPK